MGYLESVQALDSEVRRYADMRAELEASGDTAAIELATKRLAAAVKLLCEENTPLAGPLPKDKILAAKDGIVSGIVELESSAIIGHDMEDVNDLASEELVDSTLLMDISYELIGALDSNTILMRISGDASMVQDELSEDDDKDAQDAGTNVTASYRYIADIKMASSLDDAKFCGDKLTCGSGSYMSQHFAENSVLNGISGYLSKLGYGKDRSEKFYAEIAIYQVDGCERSTRVGGWDFTATINRDGNITVLQKT